MVELTAQPAIDRFRKKTCRGPFDKNMKYPKHHKRRRKGQEHSPQHRVPKFTRRLETEEVLKIWS